MEAEQLSKTAISPPLLTPINFRDHSPSTYGLEKQMDLNETVEMIVEPSGQLLFMRAKNKTVYQTVDLASGAVVEFKLDEANFGYFDEFRLLPLKEGPYSHLILCRQRQNELWIYKTARFRMDLASSEFKRTSDWKNIVKSVNNSGSCFIGATKIYFLYETRQNLLVFREFDINEGRLCMPKVRFNNDAMTMTWNAWDFKFRNFHNGQIYGFRKFRDHSEYTNDLRELYKNYSKLVRRRLKDGQIKRKKLRNSLECLEISDGAYDEDSLFYVDGQWSGRRFYLHVQIRSSPSRMHSLNYFALLNVDTRLWRPIDIHTPRGKLAYPMRMMVVDEGTTERLVFLRTYSLVQSPFYDENNVTYCYDMYRVAVRTPTSLFTMCAIKTDDYHRSNAYLMQGLRNFLHQPLNM